MPKHRNWRLNPPSDQNRHKNQKGQSEKKIPAGGIPAEPSPPQPLAPSGQRSVSAASESARSGSGEPVDQSNASHLYSESLSLSQSERTFAHEDEIHARLFLAECVRHFSTKPHSDLLFADEIDQFAVPSGASIEQHAHDLYAWAEEMAQGKSGDRFERIGKAMLDLAKRSAIQDEPENNVIQLPTRRVS